jgi:mono/diheme cytochrome c family protein
LRNSRTAARTVSIAAGLLLAAACRGTEIEDAIADDYDGVSNPVAASPESLELGQVAYDIYCTVCHGPEGRGEGNVEGPFPRGLINMLNTQRAQELSDGYLFGMISVVAVSLKNYRRIPQEERWHIVNYVRELQRQYGE